jgi:non-ribosomal peptide synthetase component E (peptide arylation enzyme)
MEYGNDIICKARSNLCKLDDANTKKQSLDLLFLSSPTSTYRVLSGETVGKTQLVPRLHTKYSK